MRTVDEKKIQAIRTAVIDLVHEAGTSKLTTARVAQKAGVSPATIYLHYSSKTDMLSRLYEQVKREMLSGLSAVIDPQAPLDEQITAMLKFSVERFEQHPKEGRFLQVFWENKDLLDEQAAAFRNTTKDSLVQLYRRIHADPAYTDAPDEVLDIFFSVPTLLMARSQNLDARVMEQVYEMTLRSIKT